ncbi:alpha/beta fold hydrolase [Caldisalinibacter kiritimatiensis]|uniref:Putative alpha/beta hydrolase superfamily protein n=1 Tax=Caldisalinibacter kiritimatiensis TaxID=1304284 RepID=R1CLB3_9FIRM|nr:alpha/beta fold hydrolase [Caldisalinibacter kiritimatiensis]EOC99475.1 Putative alpha/beta hydrolase superfamily protein [Caldisalinibacter kiritimatiensis]
MGVYRPICLPTIPNVLGGEDGFFQSEEGKIYYTEKGKGEALLLIHGINGGASNFTWRKNFNELSKNYKVYAIDLPGFGRSEKNPIKYTSSVYCRAILEFIQEKIKRPCYIISSGLSAAYSFFIAFYASRWVKSLVLITPSGIRSNSSIPCEASFTTYNIFTSPVYGDAVYNSFISIRSVEYFLKTFIYENLKNVTPFVIKYTFGAAHQCPNAKYAPASFVSGFSNINIVPFLSSIKQPVLIVWGEKAKLSSVQNIYDFKQLNPLFNTYIFKKSGLVPQIEEAQQFNNLAVKFFRQN